MKHFALVCPELAGHLNPMITLGAELRRRGRTVTFVGKLDGQAKAEAAGLGFRAIATDECPAGAMAAISGATNKLRKLASAGNVRTSYRRWIPTYRPPACTKQPHLSRLELVSWCFPGPAGIRRAAARLSSQGA